MRGIVTICILVLLAGCGNSKYVTPSEVGLVPLQGYFVKNNVLLQEEFNYLVITNKGDFDNIFGIAATGNSKIIKPDFSGQVVLAIAGKSSETKKTIWIERAVIGDKEMNVYFSTASGGVQTFSSTSLSLAAVPRSRSVRKVNFYKGEALVKKVQVLIN